jgi:hypothetical protein
MRIQKTTFNYNLKRSVVSAGDASLSRHDWLQHEETRKHQTPTQFGMQLVSTKARKNRQRDLDQCLPTSPSAKTRKSPEDRDTRIITVSAESDRNAGRNFPAFFNITTP